MDYTQLNPLRTTFLIGAATMLAGISVNLSAEKNERLDHRDDFQMDSISGGAFRDYIAKHITEESQWAEAMRTFGSFHNFMHEMMSTMARHAVRELGHGDYLPDFRNRISGGQWRDYRAALEEANEESAWIDLVQITEIMHDRVHHAMVKSLMYDQQANNRDVDLSEYIRGEPLPTGEGIPDPEDLQANPLPLDAFREFAWRVEGDDHFWHVAQQMVAFGHMLDDLLTQWVQYGAALEDEASHPPEDLERIRGRHGWQQYARAVADSDDLAWREFVQVAGLMQNRIHHIMYKAAAYQE